MQIDLFAEFLVFGEFAAGDKGAVLKLAYCELSAKKSTRKLVLRGCGVALMMAGHQG
jgi:hypothetical protein